MQLHLHGARPARQPDGQLPLQMIRLKDKLLLADSIQQLPLIHACVNTAAATRATTPRNE